jgi:hypothetical protein
MKEKKIKTQKLCLLPKEIVNDIKSLKLTRIQEEKCLHLVSLIRNKSKRDNENYYGYVELPSSLLKKIYSEKYKITINYLLDNNIIICDNTYRFGDINNKSLCYKINSKYISNSGYSSISLNSVLFNSNPDYIRDRDMFINDIKQVKIDRDKLMKITLNRINSLSISDFKTNEEITQTSFEVCFKQNNIENIYWTSLENAFIKAKENKMSLIQDKRKFYIMDETEFIQLKKDFIFCSYKDSIDKLDKKYYYASRNNTNNRLDSNITNMCGEIIGEIINQNNLVELDLSNSQFAILSYVMPNELKGDDISLFKQLSFDGGLYDYIKEILSLETRKQAKQITFELLFSSWKNKSPLLNKLKEFFPNVINWINEYKKENGSNQFAIMLQKQESQMFIDDIWKELKKQKFFALTKHDCIICKKENENQIREFIQMYFYSIGFEGKLSNK